MRNIYIQTVLAFAAILLGFSCAEDKGNYSYTELNEVAISDIKDKYDVELGKELVIAPTLEYTLKEAEEEFAYEWYLLKGSKKEGEYWTAVKEEVLLQEGTTLNLMIGGENFPASGSYLLGFKVTNKQTSVAYFQRFEVNVSLTYRLGYVAITEKEDGFDLDVIAYFNDKFSLFTNVLTLSNTDIQTKNCKPLGVLAYDDTHSPVIQAPLNQRYAFIVMSDKSTRRLLTDSYQYEDKYSFDRLVYAKEEYLTDGELLFEKLFSPTSTMAYGYSKNNWFYYSGGASGINFFSEPINRMKNEKGEFVRFNISSHIAPSSQSTLLFDTDMNRFVYHKAETGNTNKSIVMVSKVLVDQPGDPFNWNNPGVDIIHLGSYRKDVKYVPSFGYAIVKDQATSKIRFWHFDLYGAGAAVPIIKLAAKDFPSDQVKNAKFFDIAPNSKYLYYATDDNLYCAFIDDMSNVALGSGLIPAGHKISQMKFLNYNNRITLAVGTYDPNGPVGANGTIQFFEFDANGALKLAKHPEGSSESSTDMRWSGLGKIVDITAKAK